MTDAEKRARLEEWKQLREGMKYWGLCPDCGQAADHHEDVRNDHYAVCESCRAKWWIGSGLFSGWMNGTPEEWEATKAKLSTYRTVEPVEAP